MKTYYVTGYYHVPLGHYIVRIDTGIDGHHINCAAELCYKFQKPKYFVFDNVSGRYYLNSKTDSYVIDDSDSLVKLECRSFIDPWISFDITDFVTKMEASL